MDDPAPGDPAADPPAAVLSTRRGSVALPTFVPDATRAAVRGVLPGQLADVGIECVIVSTAHLAVQPGASVVEALGGAHRFMGWDGPLLSDSGGFQAFSLLASRQGLAQVSDDGLRYRFSPKRRYRDLTPRSCIETQLRLGSDVVYCLDWCTHPKANRDEHERSVSLTLRWARECRKAFDELTGGAEADAGAGDRVPPLLFAVVQGGPHADLRRRCAEELAEIGFDGFGFGGYPVVGGRMVDEVVEMPALLPGGVPLHGLGIGTPEHLVAAWRAGYGVFDCVLPTRNARRGVLYRDLDLDGGGRCSATIDLMDEEWVRETGPVDPGCDCLACSRFSAGYLAHLYRSEEQVAVTLGSVHNLRFYARLVAALRTLPAGHTA